MTNDEKEALERLKELNAAATKANAEKAESGFDELEGFPSVHQYVQISRKAFAIIAGFTYAYVKQIKEDTPTPPEGTPMYNFEDLDIFFDDSEGSKFLIFLVKDEPVLIVKIAKDGQIGVDPFPNERDLPGVVLTDEDATAVQASIILITLSKKSMSERS